MPIEVLMPALSPTMKEGNLAKWLKKEGDIISAGDVIAEIETDKATMEVEAVDEGTLGKIIINDNTQNVAVNSVIALILEDGEDRKSLDSHKIAIVQKPQPEEKLEKKESVKKTERPPAKVAKATPQKTINKSLNKDQRIAASPVAKRIANKNNINLANISGTGPNGRIVKDDVYHFINSGEVSLFPNKGVVARDEEEYKIVENNNIRRVIAQRLLEAKQNIPHFYLNSSIKIDQLLELRKSLNIIAPIGADQKPSYKISVNDLIIKACALALKKVPAANSSWAEEGVLLYNNVDISVAVAIEDGLITPIVRNADQKSIQDISAEMKQLVKKAKEGKLQPEEFQGGGFSISNLGMYGIDNFNAIVNPPQSCILAVGAGIEKPIAENGQIKIATIMNATLSSDHRSVDGAVGAEFIKALKYIIENPIIMLT